MIAFQLRIASGGERDPDMIVLSIYIYIYMMGLSVCSLLEIMQSTFFLFFLSLTMMHQLNFLCGKNV